MGSSWESGNEIVIGRTSTGIGAIEWHRVQRIPRIEIQAPIPDRPLAMPTME